MKRVSQNVIRVRRQMNALSPENRPKKKRAEKSEVLFLEKIPPASRNLRKLSEENAFYFSTSIGDYTGESVASLEDRELATEIEHLQNLEPIGDALRNQLIFTVSNRYEQLLKPRR